MFQLNKSYFLLVLTVVLSISFIGCSSDTKSVKFSPKEHDFGSIYIGDDVETNITIINKYGRIVTITALAMSGSPDFYTISGLTTPYEMQNKEEQVIKIGFSPSSSGELLGYLSLTHSESTKPVEMIVKGVGVAVARIKLSDSSYDFTKKLINRNHTHDIEIENIGTSDLSISSLMFSGTNPNLFSIPNNPLLINPGSKETVTITFSPIAVGNFAADLNIVHNAVNEPSTMIYHVIGEGIDVDPRITLSCGSAWDFGTVPTTITSIQVCEIENSGIDSLTVTSADLSTSAEFKITSLEDSNGNPINFPQVIAVGAKIFLTVEFSPSSTTSFNDSLTIVHDGTNEVTPWIVPLSGTGKTATDVTYNYSGSIVTWTVPAGVSMVRIETWGAQGGDGGGQGGKGSRMRGDFTVKPGDTIKILVGEKGGGIPTNALGGGGGATYVWSDGATDPMIVAGAGGGAGYGSGGTNGVDAVITQDGVDGYGTYAVGGHGTNGNGGVKPNYPQRIGGGGAGWKTDGCDGVNSASGSNAGGGKCPANGGAGGLKGGTNASNGDGGFGGGGGAQGRNVCSAAGGGGGYSGGGPGAENPSGVSYQTAAGGAGGSYNDGANQDNTAATNTGNGKVIITY